MKSDSTTIWIFLMLMWLCCGVCPIHVHDENPPKCKCDCVCKSTPCGEVP